MATASRDHRRELISTRSLQQPRTPSTNLCNAISAKGDKPPRLNQSSAMLQRRGDALNVVTHGAPSNIRHVGRAAKCNTR